MKLLLNQIAKTSYLRWCSPDHGYNRILNAQETADRRWTELLGRLSGCGGTCGVKEMGKVSARNVACPSLHRCCRAR